MLYLYLHYLKFIVLNMFFIFLETLISSIDN